MTLLTHSEINTWSLILWISTVVTVLLPVVMVMFLPSNLKLSRSTATLAMTLTLLLYATVTPLSGLAETLGHMTQDKHIVLFSQVLPEILLFLGCVLIGVFRLNAIAPGKRIGFLSRTPARLTFLLTGGAFSGLLLPNAMGSDVWKPQTWPRHVDKHLMLTPTVAARLVLVVALIVASLPLNERLTTTTQNLQKTIERTPEFHRNRLLTQRILREQRLGLPRFLEDDTQIVRMRSQPETLFVTYHSYRLESFVQPHMIRRVCEHLHPLPHLGITIHVTWEDNPSRRQQRFVLSSDSPCPQTRFAFHQDPSTHTPH